MPNSRRKFSGRRLIPENRSSLEAKLVGAAADGEDDPVDIKLTVATDDDATVDVADYFADEAETRVGLNGIKPSHNAVQPDLLKPIRDSTVIPLSKDMLARRSKEEPSFGVVGVARTPGDMLMEMRQAKDIDIETIAGELNLRREIVEALEQDRAEQVAGATYARGYLKTYARYLNIEDHVVESWFKDPDLSAEEKPSKITNTRTSAAKATRTGGLGTVVMMLLAVCVGSGLWFGYKQDWFAGAIANKVTKDTDTVRLGPQGDRPPANGADNAGEQQANASDATGTTDVQAQSDQVPSDAQRGSTQTSTIANDQQIVRANGTVEIEFGSTAGGMAQPLSAPVSTEVITSSPSSEQDRAAQNAPQSDSSETILEPADRGLTTGGTATVTEAPDTVSAGFETSTQTDESQNDGYRSVATGAPAGNAEGTVTLRGKSDSWVEISDATGKKIFLDMVHTSEVYSVRGRPPFKLLIGNAPGVDVEYEGYWVDVMGNSNDNNIARLILGDSAG